MTPPFRRGVTSSQRRAPWAPLRRRERTSCDWWTVQSSDGVRLAYAISGSGPRRKRQRYNQTRQDAHSRNFRASTPNCHPYIVLVQSHIVRQGICQKINATATGGILTIFVIRPSVTPPHHNQQSDLRLKVRERSIAYAFAWRRRVAVSTSVPRPIVRNNAPFGSLASPHPAI
jgi:hypothetical protein